MTVPELRELVVKSDYAEKLNNLQLSLNCEGVDESHLIKGLVPIYEYVLKQSNGWEELGDLLPKELNFSKTFFVDLKRKILNFCIDNTEIYHDYEWRNVTFDVSNYNQRYFPYDIPEVPFLVRINNLGYEYFKGAYNYLIIKSTADLNSKNRFVGAMMAYEFEQKDLQNITKRRDDEKTSLSKMKLDWEKHFQDSNNQLTEHLIKSNIDYQEHIQSFDRLKNERDTEFYKWYDNIKDNIWANWYNEKTESISILEKLYSEKLKLEEPAKYWKDKSGEYKTQGDEAKKALYWLVGICSVFLALILIIAPSWIFTNVLRGNEVAVVKWSLVFFSLMALIAYAVRALSRYMFSSYHLGRDAEERNILTYFYLALIKDSAVKDEDRNLILQSLFSRTETGLLKDDGSPTLPTTEIINKFIKSK